MDMKAFAVALALAASGAAFCGRVPIDARFVQNGERAVRGWTFNEVKGYEPFGDVNAVMLDGLAGVRLTSKGKPTTIYLKEAIHVKTGNVCILKARARGKGKGRGAMGFFAYGERWAWKGSHGATVTPAEGLDTQPVAVEARFTVPEGVETVRPTLTVPSGSDVEYFDVTLDVE